MPDRLTADVIRHGIANRLFAGSLQMPLPVVADSGIFLLGNSAPIGVMPGRPAADGAFKMSMAQTAGTGRIEDFNHNDRFQSVRLYKVKRMIV